MGIENQAKLGHLSKFILMLAFLLLGKDKNFTISIFHNYFWVRSVRSSWHENTAEVLSFSKNSGRKGLGACTPATNFSPGGPDLTGPAVAWDKNSSQHYYMRTTFCILIHMATSQFLEQIIKWKGIQNSTILSESLLIPKKKHLFLFYYPLSQQLDS